MNWLESLLLGILQGLTEFLPVSSSGHLTIGQELLNLNTSAADNLLFTVTVHAAINFLKTPFIAFFKEFNQFSIHQIVKLPHISTHKKSPKEDKPPSDNSIFTTIYSTIPAMIRVVRRWWMQKC